MYEVQLMLGLLACLGWGCVAGLWFASRELGPVAILAAIVAAAAGLIILVFGSLRLLGGLSDAGWTITGTGLRAVVAIASIVALSDLRRAKA